MKMTIVSNVWKYKYGELFYSIPGSDRDKGFECNRENYTFMGTIQQEVITPKKKVTKYIKGWTNIYPKQVSLNIHLTKESADAYAENSRIACIEINQPYEVEE